MGGSTWMDSDYTDRVALRAATGTKAFAYSAAAAAGTVAPTHTTLDPSKMKAGGRECRDSDDHPESNPIFIGLDVTGSMQRVPAQMQLKLKELMALLLRKGYITDPAICVTGIGDAEAGDKAPFQVGQFESGIEIENDLTNLYLEGGGGGNAHESYDLALYFLARLVKTDAWEKRQKKGYAFIICDESLPSRCKATSITKVFNITEQGDIPIEELIKEVLEKWELFVIVPNMTQNYKTSYQDSWVKVLGQRLIYLDDPNAVVETIATAIGLQEESVDMASVASHLKDVSGLTDKAIKSVTTALAKVEGTGMVKATKGTGLATLQGRQVGQKCLW